EGGRKLPDFVVGDAQKVAREGFEACIKGEVICIPELINKATALSFSKSPRWLVRRLTGLLGRGSL
ncbi:MAG: short-chain dehydrogenase, partial [Pseudomonadota bacterium]|nr:short-chain dehydrogenase [Pseudomonadota bacterium]